MTDQGAHRMNYHGTVGGYYPIFLKNLFFRIITLGFYGAWATTNNRKYFVANTEFAGGRMDYHGTGIELFIGYLKAFGIFFAAFLGLFLLSFLGSTISEEVGGILFFLSYMLMIVVFISLAIVGALRYRLSRTSWNNIRSNFTGDWQELLPTVVKGSLLSLVTLGLYYPFFLVQLMKYCASHAHLGNKGYEFRGDGMEYLKICLIGLLLTIVTLGVYIFWFEAKVYKYLSANLYLDGHPFDFNATGGEMFVLIMPNILIIVFTLGLGLPIVAQRVMEFFSTHLSLNGNFDPQSVQQGEMTLGDATGEGVSALLDLDL